MKQTTLSTIILIAVAIIIILLGFNIQKGSEIDFMDEKILKQEELIKNYEKAEEHFKAYFYTNHMDTIYESDMNYHLQGMINSYHKVDSIYQTEQ